MTIMEMAIWFETRGWVMGDNSFVEYHKKHEGYTNSFHVFYNSGGEWILEDVIANRDKAFQLFLKNEFDPYDDRTPIVKRPTVWAPVEELALRMLRGDPQAVDIAQDVLLKGG